MTLLSLSYVGRASGRNKILQKVTAATRPFLHEKTGIILSLSTGSHHPSLCLPDLMGYIRGNSFQTLVQLAAAPDADQHLQIHDRDVAQCLGKFLEEV